MNSVGNIDKKSLITPVYINEKIVIDMLAIIEDGFSKVSQISTQENNGELRSKSLDSNVFSVPIIDKFLKINLGGTYNKKDSIQENQIVEREKVHTNVSLFSKFRDYLINKNILKIKFDMDQLDIGDFIEIQGELQKNPLIEFLDSFISILKMTDIFEKNTLKQSKSKKIKEKNTNIYEQIESFINELKHSGTIDFILYGNEIDIVLSVQERYLTNDNISEIIGGSFKILGKVIAICKNDTESINLLRKTTLSLLSDNMIEEIFKNFNNENFKDFNFPRFRTKIQGPALIVIPIAIYA